MYTLLIHFYNVIQLLKNNFGIIKPDIVIIII